MCSVYHVLSWIEEYEVENILNRRDVREKLKSIYGVNRGILTVSYEVIL